MKARAVTFLWNGTHMAPLPRFIPLCNKQFVAGQEYPMEIVEDRSMDSHRQYFAAVHDGWMNLGEADTERFKSSEHLRAWALVHTGFCTETDYPCDNYKEALLAARIIRSRSAYSVIKISGDVVKVFDPESQAIYGPGAMKPKRFQESKVAVLGLIESMTGVESGTLMKEAGKSA